MFLFACVSGLGAVVLVCLVASLVAALRTRIHPTSPIERHVEDNAACGLYNSPQAKANLEPHRRSTHILAKLQYSTDTQQRKTTAAATNPHSRGGNTRTTVRALVSRFRA